MNEACQVSTRVDLADAAHRQYLNAASHVTAQAPCAVANGDAVDAGETGRSRPRQAISCWGTSRSSARVCPERPSSRRAASSRARSEEHTSELQSLRHLVCRLLLEKKKARRRQVGK